MKDKNSRLHLLGSSLGFGLMEVLISMGLTAIALAALAAISGNARDDQKRMVFQSDANSLVTNLASTLSNPIQCQTALASTSLLTTNRLELSLTATTQATPNTYTIGGISSGNFEVGTAKYLKATLMLQSLISGSTYNALLNVEVTPRIPDGHVINTHRRVPITLTMIDSNPTSAIASCYTSNLVFSQGNANSFGAVSCPAKQVLAGISSTGDPICTSIFNMLPSISCAANEYVGMNPTTQTLFCIGAGPASPVKTPGGGCTGTGCVTNDGGPCYGTACVTNGSSCTGTGCKATATF